MRYRPQADFVLNGELQKGKKTWDVQVRMTRTADREVVLTAPATITVGDAQLSLQQSRLAASISHPLAVRISTLLAAKPTESGRGAPPGSANIVIEQATASILRTTRDRFETAQTPVMRAYDDTLGTTRDTRRIDMQRLVVRRDEEVPVG